MPEQETIPIEEAPEESTAAAGGSSILARIKILLFVVVVITVECLAACMLLPDASATTDMAEAMLETNSQDGALAVQDDQQDTEEALTDQIEVDLGEFDVSAFQPITETTLRISFQLWGTVAENDEDEFFRLMEGNQHRFREQVLVTVRSVDVADLADAGLGLVKRKILEKANQTLGKPLLRTIIFSDFSFIEQ